LIERLGMTLNPSSELVSRLSSDAATRELNRNKVNIEDTISSKCFKIFIGYEARL